jgi:hypothetical protein
MNTIVKMFSILLICSSCSKEIIETDNQYHKSNLDIKGPVSKQVINQYSTTIENGEIKILTNEKEAKKIERNFDKHGYITSYVEYNNAGNETFYNISYNEQRKVTEITAYNVGEVLVYKLENEYDDSGKIISKKVYNSNGDITEKRMYKYDSIEYIIEVINFYDQTSLSRTEIHKLNQDWKVIESKVYNHLGTEIMHLTYKRDSTGNLTKRQLIEQGELKENSVISYDNNNNKVKVIFTDHRNDNTIEYSYEYNNKNLLTKEIAKNRIIEIEKIFSYNSKNLPIEMVEYNNGRKAGEIMFTYDHYDNLIKWYNINTLELDILKTYNYEYY